MRILYLNTTYAGGGAEKVVRQIYQGMQQRGHEVYEIVCYNRRGNIDDPHVHVLYPNNLMKVFMRVQTYNRGNHNKTIPYAISYIRKFVKEHQIELIHLHNPHDNFLGIHDIAALTQLCPVVWTLHDLWALTGHCAFPYGCIEGWGRECTGCQHLELYPRLRKDRSKELWKEKKAAFTGKDFHFTVPSQWMKAQVEHSYLKGEFCQVIDNSIDVSLWKPLEKAEVRKKYDLDLAKYVLAFVAADLQVPQKGMKILVETLQKLEHKEKYVLLVAGKGSEKAEELFVGFAVKSFGYISDQRQMNEFLSMADLMVNPSVYETFGLVNIEAMASGTPVLAFDIGVMSEVVGEHGWCVPEVSADLLKNKIEEILDNKEELEYKTRLCHDYVEMKYDEKMMLDTFEHLYYKVVKGEV